MKKVLEKIKSLTVIVVLIVYAATFFLPRTVHALSGDGTAQTPFLIFTCSDLQTIDDNMANSADYYLLNNDIDCQNQEMSPLFANSPYFMGHFDGGSHSISGLNIVGSVDVGLFAHTESANIHDLKIVGGTIAGTTGNVGSLVGQANNTTVANVFSTMQFIDNGADYVGGLIGYSSVNSFAVNLSGLSYSGDVFGNNAVGGLIGKLDVFAAQTVTLSKNFSEGSVQANYYGGGLLGYTYIADGGGDVDPTQITLEDSYTQTDVTASVNTAGGLVGAELMDNNTDNHLLGAPAVFLIQRSYSSGNISSLDNVGGLLGIAQSLNDTNETVNISNSFTTAIINGGIDGLIHPEKHGFALIGGNNFMQGGNLNLSNNFVGNFGYTYQQQAYYDGDGDTSYIDTAGSQSDYFYANHTNAPFDSPWDFSTIWNEHDNRLPTFEDWGQTSFGEWDTTDTTIHLNWTPLVIHTQGENFVTGQELEYRVNGSNDAWTPVDVNNSTQETTITGLQPGTIYVIRHHFTDSAFDGFSDWSTFGDLVTYGDNDHDGINDYHEHLGPNNGDANNDNVADNAQANVTPFLNPITGKYVVIQTEGCDPEGSNRNTQTSVTSLPADFKDSGYTYPAGVMNFTTQCGSPCCPCDNVNSLAFLPQSYDSKSQKVSAMCCPCGPPPNNPTADVPRTFKITQFWYGNYNAQEFVVRKYNSVTHSYTTIPGATITNETIGSQKAIKVVYNIVDNGPYDEDPTVGKVKDPSGPAVLAVQAPNTGFGGKF